MRTYVDTVSLTHLPSQPLQYCLRCSDTGVRLTPWFSTQQAAEDWYVNVTLWAAH